MNCSCITAKFTVHKAYHILLEEVHSLAWRDDCHKIHFQVDSHNPCIKHTTYSPHIKAWLSRWNLPSCWPTWPWMILSGHWSSPGEFGSSNKQTSTVSRRFSMGESIWCKISDRRGHRPPTICTQLRQASKCITNMPLTVFAQRNFVTDFLGKEIHFCTQTVILQFWDSSSGGLRLVCCSP